MPAEKELRLALVCYGGVSLAVYMHGITKELWKLVRASEAHRAGRDPDGDTGALWLELLQDIAADTELTVLCDVLAGASAGGLNAILLSNALTLGQSLEPLTDMWIEKADVDNLLDPDAAPRKGLSARLARFYKEPVAWLAARHSSDLASVDVPEVRAEVTVKLAHFIRSRWFKPPFSGDGLTLMLDEAMEAMEKGPIGPPLMPPALPLSLFVTTTDYWGVRADLAIHSPPVVRETEHRRLFAFESPPQMLILSEGAGVAGGAAVSAPAAGGPQDEDCVMLPRAPAAERPALLFTARATTSFPGAFPPATIGEVDRRLKATGKSWPGRSAFVAHHLESDRPPEEVALIDGSVLENAPFGPAIEAIKKRPAHRQVDRRFVYIDPKPGVEGPMDLLERKPPGFLTAILRSLVDIPRTQPIRDSLEQIAALSRRSTRLRAVTDAVTGDIDRAILRAVGSRFFLLPMTAERIARARSWIQSQAAREAGFAFGAYAQLKLGMVVDDAADLVARALRLPPEGGQALRQALLEEAARRGAFRHEDATGPRPEQSAYVMLLRQLDAAFRIRRLRFLIRHLTTETATMADPAEREHGEALRAELYRIVAPFEARKEKLGAGHQAFLAAMVGHLLAAATAAERQQAAGKIIDRLAAALDLSALDRHADAVLTAAVQDKALSRPARRSFVRAWLGYPFYDIVILPLIRNEGLEGLEELKVDRIAPDDANALVKGGARTSLKGWQLNSFAGFFSRAYRENDYLWGRLHAAERLFDILQSSVPGAALDERRWKTRLFTAILASEEGRLTHIPGLVAELRERIRIYAAGGENREREEPEKL